MSTPAEEVVRTDVSAPEDIMRTAAQIVLVPQQAQEQETVSPLPVAQLKPIQKKETSSEDSSSSSSSSEDEFDSSQAVYLMGTGQFFNSYFM